MDRAVEELSEDEAFSTLRPIAEGQRRKWLSYYDFEDQVYALNLLASLETREALKFIRWFFDEEVREHESGYHYTEYCGEKSVWAYEEHIFPHAGGQLGDRLYYTVTLELWYTTPRLGSDRILESRNEVPHYKHHGRDKVWDGYKYKDKDEEAHEAMNSILGRIGG